MDKGGTETGSRHVANEDLESNASIAVVAHNASSPEGVEIESPLHNVIIGGIDARSGTGRVESDRGQHGQVDVVGTLPQQGNG